MVSDLLSGVLEPNDESFLNDSFILKLTLYCDSGRTSRLEE